MRTVAGALLIVAAAICFAGAGIAESVWQSRPADLANRRDGTFLMLFTATSALAIFGGVPLGVFGSVLLIKGLRSDERN